MACTVGQDGVIQVEGVAIAQVTAWTVTETAETIDCSSMDSNGARDFKAGMTTFTGSADLVWEEQDSVTALNVGGASVTLAVWPKGLGDTNKMEGEIIITSFEITSEYDGLVEGSIAFQGTGALTRTQ